MVGKALIDGLSQMCAGEKGDRPDVPNIGRAEFFDPVDVEVVGGDLLGTGVTREGLDQGDRRGACPVDENFGSALDEAESVVALACLALPVVKGLVHRRWAISVQRGRSNLSQRG